LITHCMSDDDSGKIREVGSEKSTIDWYGANESKEKLSMIRDIW